MLIDWLAGPSGANLGNTTKVVAHHALLGWKIKRPLAEGEGRCISPTKSHTSANAAVPAAKSSRSGWAPCSGSATTLHPDANTRSQQGQVLQNSAISAMPRRLAISLDLMIVN
eukprot:TRINITY_DN1700_c0_g2_i4.p1 TRINITY_DN1700_c0_g2~~TRINITY_DN1700_c0_g2_i4.p1  ORF type:complete len:113 (+),score=4.48 TRINITY_DN1700_c0_g2_i4:17-355(+)